MKIEIFGKNYSPSEQLDGITEKKCEKLARRLKNDKDASVKFVVALENGLYETDAVVTSRGQTYRAKTSSASPFDNLDVVIPKLLGQMTRQKTVWGKSQKGAPSVYGGDEE